MCISKRLTKIIGKQYYVNESVNLKNNFKKKYNLDKNEIISLIESDRSHLTETNSMYTTKEILRPLPERLQALLPAKTLSFVVKLRTKINHHNKWEKGSWVALVSECRTVMNDPVLGQLYRVTLEDLLRNFPTSVIHWRELIKYQIDHGETEQVKDLFREVLSMPLLRVSIWQDYIRYTDTPQKDNENERLSELKKSIEFSLVRLAQDIDSGPIWVSYIKLLISLNNNNISDEKSSKKKVSSSKWFESQVQEVFQKCLTIPHSGLDEAFELLKKIENMGYNLNSEHSGTNKKVNDKLIYKFYETKEKYNQRRTIYKNASLEHLPLPFFTENLEIYELKETWRQIIEYERSSMIEKTQDGDTSRLELAYEQALIPLYRQPELWLEYTNFTSDYYSTKSDNEKIQSVLERAAQACPHTAAISLMQAVELEKVNNNVKVNEFYDRLCKDLESGNDRFGNSQGSLLWIQYMLFLRRSGELVKSREIFLRAKNWKGCTWQVYVASAMMEWHSSEIYEIRSKIVINIFERGMNVFYSELGYVKAYVTWLLNLGKKNEIDALFERVLAKPTNQKSQPIWELYLDTITRCGNLADSLAVEQRMFEELITTHTETEMVSLRINSFIRRLRLSGINPYHKYEIPYLSRYCRLDIEQAYW
eukprot:gnl/TRDRNA2_/TRDRNA2_177843_c0_seq2.p1 gnl/TRDRNA2_/TRDRNA2_177843_c0~~gnl/TRDRNA2_/TRDRNA2_177843_c0_seq2.p1  ORF type:complete len:649 (+),score=-34.57 gnl/TRDRNA2_/TRDRNA2_177843_c0_seq2:11-1957(+)